MTKYSFAVLSSALTVAAWLLPGQTPIRLSADDLVEIAVSRNREFLAAQQRLREAQGLLRQAGVRPYPTIETEFATGRPLGTQGEEEYSAAFFQPIEMGGKRTKRVAVAAKGLDLAQLGIKDRRRLLAYEVKRLFGEVLGARLKLKAIQTLVDIDRDNYRLTNARVQEGDAAPIEARLFLTELSRTQAQQLAHAGRVTSALLELRQVLGVSLSEPIALGEQLPQPSVVRGLKDLDAASRSRADLKIARSLEEQAAAEVNLARAEARPDLTASLRYARRNSRFDQFGLSSSGAPTPLRDRDNIITVGLSVPIVGHRNEGNIQAAEARHAAARQRREFLEATIPAEVEAAYRRLEAAKEVFQLLSSGVIDQAEQNLAVLREAYQLGQLRALDVLNEQRKLTETRLAYVDAQLEIAQAAFQLERAVGGKIE